LDGLRPWRRHLGALVSFVSSLALVLAGGARLSHLVTAATPGHQLPDTGSSAGNILHRMTSTAGLEHVAAEMAGQGLYLLAGTAGCLAIAVVVLVTRRHRAQGWASPPPGPIRAFLLLALLAEAVLSAVYLATGNRIDDYIYGRYIEVFIPPVVLIGALGGMGLARTGRRWRGFGPLLTAAAGLAVVATGVALEWGRILSGTVVTANIFALADLVKTSPDRVSVSGLALAGLLTTAVALAAFRLSALGGAVVVVALMMPATAYGYSYLVNQSDGRLSQRALPAAIVALEQRHQVSCVSWDSAIDDDWSFYNSRLFAPEMTFDVFDARNTSQLPCDSGLVVADHSFGSLSRYSGARLLLSGPSPASLWVMPGPLQRQLAGQVPPG
jgi:hypothetical protein